jgi:predicted ATPase
MEKLVIKKFLDFENLEIEIKPFTILIGETGTGKSVLAKLVYFFKDIFPNYLPLSIFQNKKLEDFYKLLEEEFIKFFPKEYWVNDNLNISYIQNNTTINLIKEKNDFLIQSDYFDKLYKEVKKDIDFVELKKEEVKYIYFINLMEKYYTIKFNIFIPAEREFFYSLDSGIFDLLEQKININNFLILYGKFLRLFRNSNFIDNSQDIKNIFNGNYKYDGQDYINYTTGKKVRLQDSSSGEQSGLPMSLILNYFKKEALFFLEEPELNLFPTKQKQIIEMIAKIYNSTDDKGKKNFYFITTHSPYILVTLNNLIMAKEVLNKYPDNKELQDKYKDKAISFEDVVVYKIQKGKSPINILNTETNLIQDEYIDEISEGLSKEFDEFLEKLYND